MTKSRTARLLLVAAAAALPGPGLAQPSPTPEQMVAAYQAQIRDAMGIVGVALGCPRGEGRADDPIVVCGRHRDYRMQLPAEPEPGTRNRLVAGESPSGVPALDLGRACCAHGGGINLLGVGAALARGADRILHPD